MTAHRARREPETTRARLLDAAARVFLESGYDGARVVEIAREAGVTTGAIYAHFRDKTDLLIKALATRGVEPVGRKLLSDTRLPVTRMLRRLGEIAVAKALHPSEALLLDAATAARRERELREQLACVIEAQTNELASVVERARAERVVASDVSTPAIVRFLLILIFGSIVTRTLGLDPPDPKAWEHLLDRLLGGVAPPPRTGSRRRPRGSCSATPRRPQRP